MSRGQRLGWTQRYGASVIATVLLSGVACRPGTPVVDLGEKPPQITGTISGAVTTADGKTPVVGRQVTAIEASTGAQQTVVTSQTGGYTLKLSPGVYRVEVQLLAGERLRSSPPNVTLGKSDLDHGINFEIEPAAPE